MHLYCTDFAVVLKQAKENDFVYLEGFEATVREFDAKAEELLPTEFQAAVERRQRTRSGGAGRSDAKHIFTQKTFQALVDAGQLAVESKVWKFRSAP